MTSGPQRLPKMASPRALPGVGGPALTPLPPKRESSSRWVWWLLVLPLLLLGLTYLLGRTVEPVRQQLVQIPLAGKLLFADDVWPILWNKSPETAAPGKATDPDRQAAAPAPAGSVPATSAEAEALRQMEQQAVERLKEAALKEQELAQREAALAEQERVVAEREAAAAKAVLETEALKVQLQGQLRTEQDRVKVIRAMKAASQTQLFAAMTDDEVIAVLKYMTADEVGKILGTMDSYRSARLLHRLTAIGSTQP